MIIIGIDPGTAETGVGIIEKTSAGIKRLHHGCIKTESKKDKALRLKEIFNSVNDLIGEYKAEVLAMESLFFNTNAKSASAVLVRPWEQLWSQLVATILKSFYIHHYKLKNT